jgi:AraC-like DNA-binding protein
MKIIQFTIPVLKNISIHVQEDKLPHFYEHLHRHNEIQITWVIAGEGTLIAGNTMQQFKPGNVFLLGANQPHLFKSDPAYFKGNKNKHIHSLNVFFSPCGFLSHLLMYPELRNIKRFAETSTNGMQALEKDEQNLCTRLLTLKNSYSGYRFALFIELLQTMANIKQWKPLSIEPPLVSITDTEGLRMNDVYQYIIANHMENITLEQISQVACMTPQSFCRYFKKHTSKTFISFLTEIRINEACRKLMDNNFKSISAVAYQSGFSNIVNFNRIFKSMLNKSPREFVREYNTQIDTFY